MKISSGLDFDLQNSEGLEGILGKIFPEQQNDLISRNDEFVVYDVTTDPFFHIPPPSIQLSKFLIQPHSSNS